MDLALGSQPHNIKNFSQQEELIHPSQHIPTMLNCPGEGCGYKTQSDRALTAHRTKCKKAAMVLASIAEEVEQYEADHREAKRRKVSSLEHSEVVSEAEEPMNVDLEVSFMVDSSKSGCLML